MGEIKIQVESKDGKMTTMFQYSKANVADLSTTYTQLLIIQKQLLEEIEKQTQMIKKDGEEK